MSTKALAWAVEQPTGSPTRKLILLLLADLADEQLTCYPGRPYLATRAELSEGTVSRTITELREGGFIRVLRRARKRGGRRTNRYLINMYGVDTPLPDVDDWVSEFAGTDDETAAHDNSDADAHMPDDADEPDDETAAHDNNAPDAHLSAADNGAADAPLNVTDTHVSNKEDSYPLGVNKELPTPPPTFTHSRDDLASAAAIAEAQAVMRRACEGVEVHRLPGADERARLVTTVVDLLAGGWDAEQLAARLVGMGPLTSAASPYAVLVSRLRQVGPPPPPVASAVPAAPWCRSLDCDKTTRRLVDDDERPRFAMRDGQRVALWCPTCSGR
jgi:DNA-binding transcriptional ArsR family regulator